MAALLFIGCEHMRFTYSVCELHELLSINGPLKRITTSRACPQGATRRIIIKNMSYTQVYYVTCGYSDKRLEHCSPIHEACVGSPPVTESECTSAALTRKGRDKKGGWGWKGWLWVAVDDIGVVVESMWMR